MSGTGSGTKEALDLGSVYLERSNVSRSLTVDVPLPSEADTFLGDALDLLEKEGGLPRLLFVTSPESEVDAGLLAIGLARAAARKGIEVLLVDLSLRSPVLSRPFPYQPEEGVADMVLWGSSLQAVLRKTRNERIRLITAGSPPPDPDRFLREQECDTVLNTLRGESELVIVVGPLKNDLGEPSDLFRKADRTVLVSSRSPGLESIPESLAPERVALVAIGEEPGEAPAATPEERKATKSDGGVLLEEEKGRFPFLRTVLAFAVVSVLIGVVLSNLYLKRGGPAGGESPIARTDGAPELTATADPTPAAALTAKTTNRTDDPVSAPPPGTIPTGTPPADEAAVEDSRPEVAGEAKDLQAPPLRLSPAVPPGEGPFYGVHVESFSSRDDAERGAARFRATGAPVVIVSKEIPGQGTWYRVVLGRYPSLGEAKARVELVKEEFGISYALAVRLESIDTVRKGPE